MTDVPLAFGGQILDMLPVLQSLLLSGEGIVKFLRVKGRFSCIKSVQTLSSAEIRTETTVFFMQSLNTTHNSFPLFWVSETLRCYSFRQHCCFFSTNIGIFLYLSGFFKIEVQFVPSWLGMNRFSVLTPLSPRLLMCNCSCQWQNSLYLFCS